MPLSCSESVLTGADGLVTFKPAGGKSCLRDFADFPAGDTITILASSGYLVGDKIKFEAQGTSNLDSALTVGTDYYVVARNGVNLKVSATSGGTPITLNGDGGLGPASGGIVSSIVTASLPTTSGNYTGTTFTGVVTSGGAGAGLTVDVTITASDVGAGGIVINAGGAGYLTGETLTIDGGAIGGTSITDDINIVTGTTSAVTAGGDTAGPANHIEANFSDYQAVCSVQEWSLSLTRDSIDTTTLPCTPSTSHGNVAPVRTSQPSFLSGEGSMSIMFTEDQTTMGRRLLASSVMSDSRVAAKLYISAVSGGASIDDSVSTYFDGDLNLMGFDITVNTSDAITASVTYSLAGQPRKLFGVMV